MHTKEERTFRALAALSLSIYPAHSHSTLFLLMCSIFLFVHILFHCSPLFSSLFHYLFHSALGLPPSLLSYFRWLHLSLSHSLLLLTSRYLEVSLGDTKKSHLEKEQDSLAHREGIEHRNTR